MVKTNTINCVNIILTLINAYLQGDPDNFITANPLVTPIN